MAVSVSAPSVNPASPLRLAEVAALPASQPPKTAEQARQAASLEREKKQLRPRPRKVFW